MNEMTQIREVGNELSEVLVRVFEPASSAWMMFFEPSIRCAITRARSINETALITINDASIGLYYQIQNERELLELRDNLPNIEEKVG